MPEKLNVNFPLADLGFHFIRDVKSWGAFEDLVTKPRQYQESCGWMFIDRPFCSDHRVFLYPVKNMGRKGFSTFESFAPDKREFQRVKEVAKKMGLTRVGNVHTHVIVSSYIAEEHEELPYVDNWEELIESKVHLPSKDDLRFARRFNDILRGVITVFFSKDGEKGQIYARVFHDQFGKTYFVERGKVRF